MPALRTRHLRGIPGCFAFDCLGTVDTCIALLGVVLRPLVSGSHFDAGLPEEYNTWILLGNDFQMDVVFSSFLGSSVDTYFRQSPVALSPEQYEKIEIFLELTSGFVPFLHYACFDSGFFVSLRVGLVA